MNKYQFWLIMCLTSILNGAFFYRASASAMERGLEGVENQAALALIPALWVLAGLVVLAINVAALISSKDIQRGYRFSFRQLFQFENLSQRERVGRTGFFTATVLLMLFGYALFWPEGIWGVGYALSGGALLLCLYAWQRAIFARFA